LEIRAAKPGPRLAKLSDGGGLQFWIMPDGAKRWRRKGACRWRLPRDRASRGAG